MPDSISLSHSNNKLTKEILVVNYPRLEQFLKFRLEEYQSLCRAFDMAKPIIVNNYPMIPHDLFANFNEVLRQKIFDSKDIRTGPKIFSPSEVSTIYRDLVEKTMIKQGFVINNSLTYGEKAILDHIHGMEVTKIRGGVVLSEDIARLFNTKFSEFLTEVNTGKVPISYDQYRLYQLAQKLGYGIGYVDVLKNTIDDLYQVVSQVEKVVKGSSDVIDMTKVTSVLNKQIDLCTWDERRAQRLWEARSETSRRIKHDPVLLYGYERYKVYKSDPFAYQIANPTASHLKRCGSLALLSQLKDSIAKVNPKIFASYSVGFSIIGQVGLGSVVMQDPFVYHNYTPQFQLGHEGMPSYLAYEDPLLPQQNDFMMFMAGTAVLTTQRIIQTNPYLAAGTTFLIGAVHKGIMMVWSCAVANPVVAGVVVVGAVLLATSSLWMGEEKSYGPKIDSFMLENNYLKRDYGDKAVATLPTSFGSELKIVSGDLNQKQRKVADTYKIPGSVTHIQPTRTDYDLQLLTIANETEEPTTMVLGYWENDQFHPWAEPISADYQDLRFSGQVKIDTLKMPIDDKSRYILGVSKQ